ncbi:MAG: hypothetical protein JW786_15155 [Desulfobacterales bacterium]|nr:hypothetical protein [Desulfobacterales bacterium]
MSLREYIKSFHQALEKFYDYGFAESIDVNNEIRAGKQAVIKSKIVFIDSSALYIKEYISAKYKIENISYAYQYQDKKGKTIFRYDNAVHRPDLSFKEHKHIADESIIEAATPRISELVDEVIEKLL